MGVSGHESPNSSVMMAFLKEMIAVLADVVASLQLVCSSPTAENSRVVIDKGGMSCRLPVSPGAEM